MKKQHREPDTALVPLEYVLAVRQEEERQAGERELLAREYAQPVTEQEPAYGSL